MTKSGMTRTVSSSEVVFQLVLHLVVFIFYAFDWKEAKIESHEWVFFAKYTLVTLFISYYLLPKYFYRRKYWIFLAWMLLIATVVILLEELVLEQIFFPDTRAKRFPGVFYSLLSFLPVVTILAGGKFAWDAVHKQNEVDSLREAVQESELQFLKSQINPHFLFNNLNNLYSYAIESSPKTPEIILELSSVLRYMLYECREKYVPLGQELQQLENFTRLYQLQIEERGRVQFSAPELDRNFRIAPLILLVFIENAFKHSQASQSGDIEIDIEIKLSPSGVLDFYCGNNFLPTSNTEKLSQGIGLENVKKRLELLYPTAHDLRIVEENNRFEVRLTLQLH